MNKNRNFELTGAPEDTGEDFEAAAFAALLEDMAGKARFLAETLDILAEIGREPDDPGCEPDLRRTWRQSRKRTCSSFRAVPSACL